MPQTISEQEQGVELKPCPFCGGEPEMQQSGFGNPEWLHFTCRKCAASSGAGKGEEHARRFWNTRPTPPRQDEQEARVVDARFKLTPEYLAMTPLQKWETLALNGLLGTDEPWIEDMRASLRALSTPAIGARTYEDGIRDAAALVRAWNGETRDGDTAHIADAILERITARRPAIGDEASAAILEEARKAVVSCADTRGYLEPSEWAYGAQDALVTAENAIRALSPSSQQPGGE